MLPSKSGFFLATALLLASAGLLGAAISFHQNFDSGALNIAATEVTDAESERPIITLAAREVRWNGRWLHFDVIGVNGKQPVFRVPLVGQADGAHPADHRYVFSLDGGATFDYFDEGAREEGHFVFAPSEPFSQDTVRIAYSLPYPVARTAWHTRRVGASRWVRPTPSAGPDFVIARTPGTAGGGYRDDLDREIPSMELLGYAITDPAVDDESKSKVVFLSGSHASESTAHWTLEGAVDFLISDDPKAADLRRELIVFVYPQQNPEGRWAGFMRSSPEQPTLNQNRDWTDSPRNTAVRILSDAISSDTGGEAVLFIDFHSHRSATFEIWDVDGGDETPFFQAISGLRSDARFHLSRIENNARSWGLSALNARYAFTSETGFNAGWAPEDYQALGRDHALSMHAILPELRLGAGAIAE